MKNKSTKRGDGSADKETRAMARKLVRDLGGDREAAKAIGIARATLSRLLADLPLSPGTLAILREKLGRGAAA